MIPGQRVRYYHGPNRNYPGPNGRYQGNQVACMDHQAGGKYETMNGTDVRQSDGNLYNNMSNGTREEDYGEYPNKDASAKMEIVGAIY